MAVVRLTWCSALLARCSCVSASVSPSVFAVSLKLQSGCVTSDNFVLCVAEVHLLIILEAMVNAGLQNDGPNSRAGKATRLVESCYA